MSLLRNIVIFDCEVYRHENGQTLWCCGFRWYDKVTGEVQTQIVESRDPEPFIRIKALISQITRSGRYLVGYNSRQFDLPLLARIVQGEDAKEVCQELIKFGYWSYNRDSRGYLIQPESVWEPVLDIPRGKALDLIERITSEKADSDSDDSNQNTFSRLKLVSAILGFENIEDLPYEPDQPLTDEQWSHVMRYCLNDLELTEGLFRNYEATYEALLTIQDEVPVPLVHLTNAKLTEAYFKARYEQETGLKPRRFREEDWPGEIKLPISSRIPEITTPEARAWADYVTNTSFPTEPLILDKTTPEALAVSRIVDINGFKISVGFGGVHSDHKSSPTSVSITDDEWQVVYADVASYYPTLTSVNRIPLGQMGDTSHEIFDDLIARRLKLKAKSKDVTLSDEDRKAAKTADEALKIVINATYGKSGDRYSILNAPGSNNAITISGQLGFMALIERLQDAHCEFLSCNTDGLWLKVRHADLSEARAVMAGWCEAMGVKLDIELKKGVVVSDSNNWLSLEESGEYAGKGKFRSVNPRRDPTKEKSDPAIVSLAVGRYLLEGVPVERTIYDHTNFDDFLFSAKGSRLEFGSGDNTQKLKTVRAFASYPNRGLKVLVSASSKKDEKAGWPKDLMLALRLPDKAPWSDLRRDWYVGEARRLITACVGFQWSPKDLTGMAKEIYWKGLIPAPARGKVTIDGTSQTHAVSGVDWNRFPTVKAYMGSNAGNVPESVHTVCIDIDKPELWEKWINKDAERLAGQLTVYRQGNTPESVHSGGSRGKIIFTLADPDHRLLNFLDSKQKAKFAQLGFEFIKSNLVTVLGQGNWQPESKTHAPDYLLSGDSQAMPDWLCKKLIAIVGKGSSKAKGSVKQTTDAFEEPNWVFIFRQLARDFDEAFAQVRYRSERRSATDQRFAARMCCPGGEAAHDSRTSSAGDAELFLDSRDGKPVFQCLHKSCTFERRYRQWANGFPTPPPSGTDPDRISELKESLGTLVNESNGIRTLMALAGSGSLEGSSIANLIADTKGLRAIKGAAGSGKTHGAAVAAIFRARLGLKTYFVTPTKTLQLEFIDKVRALAPDLVDRVASGTDQMGDEYKSEDVAVIGEIVEVAEESSHMFEDQILIRALCHESLNRRGFSKYARPFWDCLWRETRDGENPLLIIDEIHAFITLLEARFDFAIRGYDSGSSKRKSITRITARECLCSRATRDKSGIDCSRCELVQIAAVVKADDKHKMLRLSDPWFETRAGDDEPLKVAKLGKPVDLDIADFTTDGKHTIEGYASVEPVLAYKDRMINTLTRESLARQTYRGEMESPDDADSILSHFIRSLVFPTIKTHYAVNKLTGEFMSRDEIIAVPKADLFRTVEFPFRTCEAPYLSGFDGLPLLMLKDMLKRGVDVCLMSATYAPITLGVLEETLGIRSDDIVEVEGQVNTIAEMVCICIPYHEDYPAKIRHLQLSWLNFLKGNNWHEGLGRYLIQTPSVKTTKRLTDDHGIWTERLAGHKFTIADGSKEKHIGLASASFIAPLGMIAAQGQVPWTGYDGQEVTLVVTDGRVGRLAADIMTRFPRDGETWQEVISEADGEDRLTRQVQANFRSVRGSTDKRVVNIFLNQSPDEVAEMLRLANGQSRIRNISYQTYPVMSQAIFRDAEVWLAGDADSPWINTFKYDDEVSHKAALTKTVDIAQKRKDRLETKRLEIMRLAQEHKDSGGDFRSFSRKHTLNRIEANIKGITKAIQALWIPDTLA